MKEINLSSGNYLFVDKDSEIAENVGVKVSIKIFNKEYKYISTTKDITEEQAESIVFHHVVSGTKYHSNYMPHKSQDFRDVIDNSFSTAKESLQSLIQANELDVNKNYLILRKL